MAFIQQFQILGAKTFQQWSELYLQTILYLKPTGCSVVYFVRDRYDIPDDVSLKCDKRLRWNQSKFSTEYIPFDYIEIPYWNALLKHPLNKEHRLHYLSSSWCQNNKLLTQGLLLFLGGKFNDRSRATVVTRIRCSETDQLSRYSHEEADTRMIAHLHFTIRVPTEIQKHNSMIIPWVTMINKCNFHDYSMHSLQPPLLAASSTH